MASKLQFNSPRKFAEKIALLNKKQEEGNAAFEQIIKEVEATRVNQQLIEGLQLHHNNAATAASERQESEENEQVKAAYEDLVQTVTEYHDQLHAESLAALEPPPLASQQLPQQHRQPQQLSQVSKYITATAGTDLAPDAACSGQSWRLRGTSFGSHTQVKCRSQANTDDGDFLSADADRTWLKSSSDPALAPIACEQMAGAASCADELLGCPCTESTGGISSVAGDFEQTDGQQYEHQHQFEQHQFETQQQQQSRDYYCTTDNLNIMYDAQSKIINGDLVPGIKICTIDDQQQWRQQQLQRQPQAPQQQQQQFFVAPALNIEQQQLSASNANLDAHPCCLQMNSGGSRLGAAGAAYLSSSFGDYRMLSDNSKRQSDALATNSDMMRSKSHNHITSA